MGAIKQRSNETSVGVVKREYSGAGTYLSVIKGKRGEIEGYANVTKGEYGKGSYKCVRTVTNENGIKFLLDIRNAKIPILPDFSRELSNLTLLTISDSSIRNYDSLENLSHLKLLALDRNHLINLPSSIKKLKGLDTLFIRGNLLSYIPPAFLEELLRRKPWPEEDDSLNHPVTCFLSEVFVGFGSNRFLDITEYARQVNFFDSDIVECKSRPLSSDYWPGAPESRRYYALNEKYVTSGGDPRFEDLGFDIICLKEPLSEEVQIQIYRKMMGQRSNKFSDKEITKLKKAVDFECLNEIQTNHSSWKNAYLDALSLAHEKGEIGGDILQKYSDVLSNKVKLGDGYSILL